MKFIKKYKYTLIILLVLIVFGRFFFNKSIPLASFLRDVNTNSVVLKYGNHSYDETMKINNEEDVNKLKKLLSETKVKKIGRKAYVQDKRKQAFTVDFENELVLSFRNERNVDITMKNKDEMLTRSYRVLNSLQRDKIFELFKESASK